MSELAWVCTHMHVWLSVCRCVYMRAMQLCGCSVFCLCTSFPIMHGGYCCMCDCITVLVMLVYYVVLSFARTYVQDPFMVKPLDQLDCNFVY